MSEIVLYVLLFYKVIALMILYNRYSDKPNCASKRTLIERVRLFALRLVKGVQRRSRSEEQIVAATKSVNI